MTLSAGSKLILLVGKLKKSTGKLLERCFEAILPRSRSLKEVENDLEELKELHQSGSAQSILYFHWKYSPNDSVDIKCPLKLKLPDLKT